MQGIRIALLLVFAFALLVASQRAWSETVRYAHTDIFGNIVAISDEDGNVIERRVYEPYGLPQTAIQDGPGFTGHDMDGETGLIYMQQRYYDPRIGRFLSPDPMAVDPTTAWNFNRYNYAANNPYHYVDFDGREAVCLYTATACGMTEMTPELRSAQRTIAQGMVVTGVSTVLLAVPDPTDIAIAATATRAVHAFRASRGFSQAARYVNSVATRVGLTSGRSARRTIQYDGKGGADGARQLFNVLTRGNNTSRGAGRLGTLSDGSRVQMSSRTLKDGTTETSVRIISDRAGSRIKDHIKVRFREE